MRFLHFYHHSLTVEDKFLIWNFNENRAKRHKVKECNSNHQVTCHCSSDEEIVCTDLNYISEKWLIAPVLAHGLVASAPPTWRKIAIGKYVRVEQILQVATFAVMIGGAVLLHRASMNCAASGGPSTSTSVQSKSRPMTMSDISHIAEVPPNQLAAADATVVEVQNESILTFDLNASGNDFGKMSASTHSLSGVADEVEFTFANTLTVVEDVESEIIASMQDTFSESMCRPKSITISDAGGEFSKPLTKQFVANVERGKEFFQRVLVNEPQMTQGTKDIVQDVLHVIEYNNGVLDAKQSAHVISVLEKEIGGFKLYLNYVGSAKPPPPPTVPKEIQFYQGLMQTTKIGTVIQTSVDASFNTELTEIKRELLQQTSLDIDLMKVATVQRLQSTYKAPRFKFNRQNIPFIGHPCLIFDILDTSLTSLPDNVPMTLVVGANTYLVRGIYENALWVYCDRTKLDDAGSLAALTSQDIVLLPQQRRPYVFWMHVDAKVIKEETMQPHAEVKTSLTIKPHQDVKTYLKASGQVWLIQDGRKRSILSNYTNTEIPAAKATMMTPFQFNGIETLEVRSVFTLPTICTLLPFTHYQICTFNTDFEVLSSVIAPIQYKTAGAAYGLLCGHDYIDVTNETIRKQLDDAGPSKYKTLAFFSTYDFEPLRIKSITFNRPWTIWASFYYMTIELEVEHGISWSLWSRRVEDHYGLNPLFTMDIIGAAAEKHLHVQHRCRLKIYEVKNSTTLIFTTPLKGDETKLDPSILSSAKLAFPIDENMSTLMLYKRQREKAMQPMLC